MLDAFKPWLGQHQIIAQALMAGGVLFLSFASYFVTKHYLLKALSKIVKNTRTKFDDIFFEKAILRRLSYVVPITIIYYFAHLFPLADDINT